jgi:hypothetical protein
MGGLKLGSHPLYKRAKVQCSTYVLQIFTVMKLPKTRLIQEVVTAGLKFIV